MENNLILEGLLSMVTELKERQEKQVQPAGRKRLTGWTLSNSAFRICRANPALLKTRYGRF